MHPQDHFHGSDLEKIEAVYGIKKEEIVKFGANVNPLGISPLLRDTLASRIDAVTEYPDREYTALRGAISAYTGAALNHIMVGNGSTELISLFIKNRHPRHALLIGPTYSEYEREIRLEGARLDTFLLSSEDCFSLRQEAFEGMLQEDTDMVVLCNPNNPTSSVIDRKQMTWLVQLCHDRHITVMVDETYVEFTAKPEDITALPLCGEFPNLIVLRGVSKFFASPGLRLGYAICSDLSLLAAVTEVKNPWSINTLASIAGEIMFGDTVYKNRTRELIAKERTRICDRLEQSGKYRVFPAHANFVLIRILAEGLTSSDLFDRAIRQKLMIRDCSDFASLGDKFIRFCFMLPEDNDKLMDVLN